jgi:hypothetical protein
VFDHGAGAGVATPFAIGRHVHPAVPQAPAPPPADPGPGIDYMGLVATAHTEALGEGSIAYRDVHLPGFEDFDEPAQAGQGNDTAEQGDDNDEAVG